MNAPISRVVRLALAAVVAGAFPLAESASAAPVMVSMDHVGPRPQSYSDKKPRTIDLRPYAKVLRVAPDAEYHHKWEKGDIVIWDNRCSYHKAAGDYPPEEDRIHWRVSINDFGVEALDEAAE